MAESLNLPTVRLGMDVGVAKVIDTLHALGVTQPIQAFRPLFLGTVALSPFEVNQMYLTLASEGLYQPLTTVRAVLGANNEGLYQKDVKAERRVDARVNYLTLFTMTKVASQGTARSLATASRGPCWPVKPGPPTTCGTPGSVVWIMTNW